MDFSTGLLVFLLGAISLRFLQFMLSVYPNLTIFKNTEITCLKLIAEISLQQIHSLQILKVVYTDLEKESEIPSVEKAINEKYFKLINNSITALKNNLPYTVPYKTLKEALQYYASEEKLNEKR